MDHKAVVKAYKRYASIYDHVFGPVFAPGRRVLFEQMTPKPGEKILEVGVGTGLSLPDYPNRTKVVGVDLSLDMLKKAEDLVTRCSLENVELHQMDAQAMQFCDQTFDKVVAMYVVSVAPDPKKVIAEMKRVCKPGGDLFILNHFGKEKGVMKNFEKLLTPFSGTIGFRPNLSLDQLLEETKLNVKAITPVNLFGYWTLIHATNDAS